MSEYITIYDAKDLLKVSRGTMYNLFKNGLDQYKLGGRTYVKHKDLQKLYKLKK